MSNNITGRDPSVVNVVSGYVNRYYSSLGNLNGTKNRVDEWERKKPSLVDTPFYEQYHRELLDQYEKAAKQLKEDAEVLAKKTNHESRKLYRGHKSISSSSISFLKTIHTEAETKAKTDYLDGISNKRKESERKGSEAGTTIQHQEAAAKEYSEIDKTFPVCQNRLISENPSEYLRQSALYQHKLLKNQNPAAVLAFGKTWIRTLPKETSWEQIENMSHLLLEASTKVDNPDITEYRLGVEQWQKDNPLAENPATFTPAEATTLAGRRTYILGRLYLRDHCDLSAEALQFYQNCGLLYPNENAWKAAQSIYHASKQDFENAKQMLAELPLDDPSVIHAQQYLADSQSAWKSQKIGQSANHANQLKWLEAERDLDNLPSDDLEVVKARKFIGNSLLERKLSATLDLIAIAFSRFFPSSFQDTLIGDIVQTGLQLASNSATKRFVFSRLPWSSESISIRDLSLNSRITFLADITDFFFRRISPFKASQRISRIETFLSSNVRLGNMIGVLYANPLQRTYVSYMSVGSSAISIGQVTAEGLGYRLGPTTQAFSSTFQQITADVGTASVIAQYSDLLPVAGVWLYRNVSLIGIKPKISLISTETSQEGSSKTTWILAAVGITAMAAYRLYNYPYVWAASVMKEIDRHCFQGEYDEAKRVLKESEESYFVSRERPAVHRYADYVNRLKDYLQILQNSVKYGEFLKSLDLALKALHGVSYYADVRNNILLKKMEVAIRQQDSNMLNAVLNEPTAGRIVDTGFNFLLKWGFHIALKNPTEACSLLQEMGTKFPACFRDPKNELHELLKTHANDIQAWGQLNFSSNPSTETIEHWNTALKDFQSFFNKYFDCVVLRDLQYFKLMIACVQTKNDEKIDALFKESVAEIHDRLAHQLVQFTKVARKNREFKEAIKLLKRLQFKSFKHNELIQKYCHFFSLVHIPILQQAALLKEVKAVEKYIAGLGKTDLHNEFRVLLNACKIVLHLDTGESPGIKNPLAQEPEDSKVSAEVAALLFERLYVPKQQNVDKKAVSDIQKIISLGPWQHQGLFTTFHAYLLCKNSLEVLIEQITPLITQLTPIEQLSNFASLFQPQKFLWQFELFLFQGNFAEAKKLINQLPGLGSEFQKPFSLFLINQGEQMRQTVTLKRVVDHLQDLTGLLAMPNSDLTQSYINFLSHLKNIERNGDITVHVKTRESLETVITKLHPDVPESLVNTLIKIHQKTGYLAMHAGQLKAALAEFKAIKELGVEDGQLDHTISRIKEQLYEQST